MFTFSKTYFILIIIGIIGIISCNPKDKKPDNLLPPDVLSLVIADVKIIDAAYQAGIPPSITKTLDTADKNYKDLVKQKIESHKEKLNTIQSVKTDSLPINEEISDLVQEYESVPQEEIKNIYLGHTGADYDFIFKKHGITRMQFEESINYYSQFPKEFFDICEKALELMSQTQLKFTEEQRIKESKTE